MAKRLAPGEKLYFVAVVPPEPQRTQLTGLKEYFREKYHSSKALNSPPHITLHMPFKWKEQKEQLPEATLQECCAAFKPFSLSLRGFGAFPPRVIFIRPEENFELLKLQKELSGLMRRRLNIFNADYKDRAFHPHLTLAFRDLKKDQFQLAWEEFQHRRFEMAFEVEGICLLKHNGKSWDVFRELFFTKV